MVDYPSHPALFRAGDIGVSSEWRDITYDWSPLLTADGVFIYSYLRDSFDNQRMLRPFLLDPDGPTKQRIQRVLGRKSAYAVQGPEYLLETVGLLHVEVQRGPSNDPDRLKYTATTYYVVGRLDHPVLDWSMMERVLQALMLALLVPSTDAEVAERQRKAEAALRSLGHAGMLQNEHPEHLFEPDGAWPSLLPTLIQDERWAALFAHLHGVEAIQPFRHQARKWTEWVQRRSVRVTHENHEIREQLLRAQRRQPRSTASVREPSAEHSLYMRNANEETDGTEVTYGPCVPPLSLGCPAGTEVTYGPSGTHTEIAHQEAIHLHAPHVPPLSLNRQLINSSSGKEDLTELFSGTNNLLNRRAGDEHRTVSVPQVAPYLRDDEIVSGCLDSRFWRTVQHILYANDDRYEHTEAEKKAVRRLLNKTGAPGGVVLAALRAVMIMSGEYPTTLADALRLDVFHRCVQQAIALLPARSAVIGENTWQEFLVQYRCIGRTSDLRDVNVEDYHVLHALYERQPDACWEVLSRARHAAVQPDLSPAYLRSALLNNQRRDMMIAQQTFSTTSCAYPVSINDAVKDIAPSKSPTMPDDPRKALLRAEGLGIDILADDVTEAFILAWIAEADALHDDVQRRPNWLRWGITSGYFPHEHPSLQRRRLKSTSAPSKNVPLSLDAPTMNDLDPGLAACWQAALTALREQVPQSDFDTWIAACRLILLEDSPNPAQSSLAVIGTPNIFVREEIQAKYCVMLTDALSTVFHKQVELEVVIGS